MTEPRPIRKGDLVMVVRPAPCCGIAKKIGYTYRAHAVSEPMLIMCINCRRIVTTRLVEDGQPDEGGYRIECVIKIDPPALDESTTEPAELTA